MTIAIPPIGSALANVGAITPTVPTAPTAPTAAADGTAAASSSGFGDALAKAVDNLDATQAKSDNLAVKAATGNLTDVHDYTIASTEATLTTELTVAVRNKAVDAFNEIMRMQV